MHFQCEDILAGFDQGVNLLFLLLRKQGFVLKYANTRTVKPKSEKIIAKA